MSFLNLSPAMVWLGLLGLAAALFLLQLLRVRQQQVDVVTTLFWREALEENRARVRRQRFRHPWAYLLLLTIAALLWLATAGPRQEHPDARRQVLLLDASAMMQRPGRWQAALEQLRADLADLPAEGRTVYSCGAALETLLAPGEEARLLEARLGDRQAESAPTRLETRLAAGLPAVDATTDVLIYGDSPLREDWLAAMPQGARLIRRTALPDGAESNHGFLAAGIGEAASGDWSRVDVSVVLAATGEEVATVAQRLEITADDQPWTGPSPDITSQQDGSLLLRYAGIPAQGQLLSLKLPGQDALAADDQVVLRLPRRRSLRVSLSPALAPSFGELLAADPAVEVVTADAALQLRQAGESALPGLPALVVYPDDGGALLRLKHPGQDADRILAAAYTDLGFGAIDALGLATALGRPVTVEAELADDAELGIAASMLSADSGFPSSRAFPLLVSRGLRWLATEEELIPTAAAGRPLPGRTTRLLNAARVKPMAGEVQLADGSYLPVNLFDELATRPQTQAEAAGPLPTTISSAWPLWRWAALLALALLLWEGRLFRQGRLP